MVENPHKIVVKDPADRFDLSYVFANNQPALGIDKNALVEMVQIAKEVVPGVHCRAVLVHSGDVEEMASLIKGSPVRLEIVMDFPDGRGGAVTKGVQARVAKERGAIGGDIVINLHKVQFRDKKGLLEEFAAVKEHLNEVKCIAQVPYLWQFDRESIPWVLDVLAEAGVYCMKDWTTRVDNFLLPEGKTLDYEHETRMKYLEFMANYISFHNLPLVLKVAGKVVPENVKSFINAGAVLIGTSYRKAPALREALLS
jgi:deoxyribose-phosphate aldolase